MPPSDCRSASQKDDREREKRRRLSQTRPSPLAGCNKRQLSQPDRQWTASLQKPNSSPFALSIGSTSPCSVCSASWRCSSLDAASLSVAMTTLFFGSAPTHTAGCQRSPTAQSLIATTTSISQTAMLRAARAMPWWCLPLPHCSTTQQPCQCSTLAQAVVLPVYPPQRRTFMRSVSVGCDSRYSFSCRARKRRGATTWRRKTLTCHARARCRSRPRPAPTLPHVHRPPPLSTTETGCSAHLFDALPLLHQAFHRLLHARVFRPLGELLGVAIFCWGAQRGLEVSKKHWYGNDYATSPSMHDSPIAQWSKSSMDLPESCCARSWAAPRSTASYTIASPKSQQQRNKNDRASTSSTAPRAPGFAGRRGDGIESSMWRFLSHPCQFCATLMLSSQLQR